MANILIVDDSSTMRKIIARSLRQAGFTVDEIYEAGAMNRPRCSRAMNGPNTRSAGVGMVGSAS